jgi:DNA-binding CsgD family transcriptional regulator
VISPTTDSPDFAKFAIEKISKALHLSVIDCLTPREREAASIVRERGPIRRNELAKIMGCKPETAGVHLRCCRAAGAVHAIGLGCAARWAAGPGPTNVTSPASGLNSRGAGPHLQKLWSHGVSPHLVDAELSNQQSLRRMRAFERPYDEHDDAVL